MLTSSKSPKIDEAKIVKALEALPDFKIGKWTKFQEDMLRRFYPTKGATIAAAIGKTKQEIWKHAAYLKLNRMSE